MRVVLIVIGVVVAALVGAYAFNELVGPTPKGSLTIIAHRGVHQRFHTEDLTNETCTAARIFPPTNSYIENTIPSMKAAFDAGADMVEIDVHPTTDGEFVVFHDWGVDCRTNGKGVTRTLSLAEIKKLDVGYGYTADGGKTFPLRGKGVGMAPGLGEVLAAFPGKRFWVNGKSNDPTEADKLDAYLKARPYADPSRLIFEPGDRTAARLRVLRPEAKVMSRQSILTCLRDYELTGAFGGVPSACRNTAIGVPVNVGPFLWGWPDRFLGRMQAANTEVVLFAPLRRGERPGATFDSAADLGGVPRGWRGGVSTSAVEVTGPLLKK